MQDIQTTVGDVRFQVREYARDGNTILFLHFGGGNLMMWQGLIPQFQDSYRLLLLDLRGHGKSDKPPTGYHIDEMAADVIGVMDQLRVRRAYIVGSSLGAEVGLSLAVHFPDRVVALVCEGALSSEFGPYGTWDKSEAEFKEYVAKTLSEMQNHPKTLFDSEEALFSSTQETLEKYGMWNPVVEAFTRYDIRETSAGKFVSGWPEWVRDGYMQHYFGYRFEDYYRQVTCPILMLPAEEDMQNGCTKKATLGLSKLAPSVQVVEIPGWTHVFSWMLNPDLAGKAVLEFLKSVEQRKL